jgi:Ni/Co efflux regulator RcnB
MYALIYDERDPSRPLKEVLSVHKRRDTAEKALQRRMKQLGKRVWECHARIVWTDKRVRPKDLVAPKDFSTWRPGERLPVGERYTDSD